MKDGTIKNKVEEIITKTLNINQELKPFFEFENDLGADSFDLVELIILMEEEFDIEINDEEFFEILTIKDMIDCVKANVFGKGE